MERFASRVILLWGWRRWLAALAAGGVASLALAPFDFTAACFIAFPILVWLLDGTANGGPVNRLMAAFGTGWWFGFGYFLSGMWWAGPTIVGPEAGAALTVIAAIALPALLALFYGFAAALAISIWSDGLGRMAALAFAFAAAEALRAALFSGLAWNAIGYTAMPVPLLMQGVELIGVFGVGALAVFVFSSPALLGTRRQMKAGLLLAAFLAAVQIGYGFLILAMDAPDDEVLAVRLVQAGTDDDFNAGFRQLLTFSRASGPRDEPAPDLILWPELSVPFVLAERPDLLSGIGAALDNGQILVTGTLREGHGSATATDLHNAIMAVNADGEVIDAADQVRTLALVNRWMNASHQGRAGNAIPILNESRGSSSGGHLLSLSEGIAALPLFGFEVAIPSVAARHAGSADLIINPAGYVIHRGSQGYYQDFRQMQVRAVEARLPLITARAGGLSAAVDAKGNVLDALAIGTLSRLDILLPMAKADFFAIGNRTTRVCEFVFVISFGVLALLLSIRSSAN